MADIIIFKITRVLDIVMLSIKYKEDSRVDTLSRGYKNG